LAEGQGSKFDVVLCALNLHVTLQALVRSSSRANDGWMGRVLTCAYRTGHVAVAIPVCAAVLPVSPRCRCFSGTSSCAAPISSLLILFLLGQVITVTSSSTLMRATPSLSGGTIVVRGIAPVVILFDFVVFS